MITRRTALAAARIFALGVGVLVATQVPARAEDKPDPQNTVYLDVSYGRIVIRLRPDLAPNHVARIKQLCHDGFYDGQIFHRVIEGFMAQTGDPTGTGGGGSTYPNVKGEFTSAAHFLRGTVGAARTSDPDSANSQFFIMFAPGASLDSQYTIWGQVISGMEFVDKIQRGEPPANPDHILHMRLAADVKG